MGHLAYWAETAVGLDGQRIGPMRINHDSFFYSREFAEFTERQRRRREKSKTVAVFVFALFINHAISFTFFRRQLNLELMAAKLQQLQSKARQATQFVAKHGTAYYKQLLEQNKQYIQEPATVEKCNELSTQLFYTRLASIPGRYESLQKELEYVKNIWKNRQDLKVEQAGIAALFGLECFAWFCTGEIVGRGFTFTGYHV